MSRARQRYGPGFCYSVKFSVPKLGGSVEETFVKWGAKAGSYHLDDKYFKALPEGDMDEE